MDFKSKINQFAQRYYAQLAMIFVPLILLTCVASVVREWFWVGVVLPIIKFLLIITTTALSASIGIFFTRKANELNNDIYRNYHIAVSLFFFAMAVMAPIILFTIFF